ncbi:CapA family protein [Pseudacidovorax sp. NFM-22]|uniref:CapA family protein n=1 Tax=Pseudacidovorax sp. NFM-22 TaxID=2744469 RepID=UPI001F411D1C|nr:CapA family protein [Pseudacidovorax sp. NFM-22]
MPNDPSHSTFDLIVTARSALWEAEHRLQVGPATPEAGYVAFIAVGEDQSRAQVVMGRGSDVDKAWAMVCGAMETLALPAGRPPQRLRAEFVDRVTLLTWGALKVRLSATKRNYFNEGIAFDARFEFALLAQEIQGSAILYDHESDHAVPNSQHLRLHAQRRFGRELDFPSDDAAPVWCFTTRGVYVDEQGAWPLTAEGPAAGLRKLDNWNAHQVRDMIERGARYLAGQVLHTGEFRYGWLPCFDRALPSYNTLRHASTVYAMLEAWALVRDDALKAAIDRAMSLLTGQFIRPAVLPDGTRAAYLVDVGMEIKLGGNGVSLLALTKYTELTGDRRHLPLMEQLAHGIRHMQDPDSGAFVHVLNAPRLDVKARFRIIYYDGEAAFGLMRLYALTRDARWLAVVEKAFDHFIAEEHWRAHDHWLSYCVNELTRHRPEPRYYRFGLQNVAGHLDFVAQRITTFPTLLELMMAAHEMVQRMDADAALRPLLAELDRERFARALEWRARHLANGHFWPELAMFFCNPGRIAGAFFIKHHGFRVRIDDVEHYLSAYVAYHGLCQAREAEVAQAAGTGSVIWGGDVNLGRRQHYRLHELGGARRMLGDIPALQEADLRIVNLECVVATVGEQGVDKGEKSPYYYRARPEMLAVLTEAGIGMVATANNHSGDYGPEALLEQQTLLERAGIAHAGTGPTREAALRPAFAQAGGLRVALFSLDATQPAFAATDGRAGAAWLSLDDPAAWTATLMPRIATARAQADVVLVAVHWGANLEEEPSAAKVVVGHALIDAGADAVLGTSAHVLQGIEVYRGRPVLHDAGDLLFDSVRDDFGDSGIFRLSLSRRGVEEVRFTPVGVGFGVSRQLHGEAAQTLGARFAAQCRRLGTAVKAGRDGDVRVSLSPPGRPAAKEDAARSAAHAVEAAAMRPPSSMPLQPAVPLSLPRPEWWVSAVPEDARVTPLQLGPLRLVGLRCAPRQMVGRQLLWVESFWTADAPVAGDVRLGFRAVPMRSRRMPAWGNGMDHDPCDWMWPTSRWEAGRIYRDRYALRAPRPALLESDVLHLEVRVCGTLPELPPPRRLPLWCGLRVPAPPLLLPEAPAPVLWADRPGAAVESTAVWTAESLQQATGGRWRVQPPPGWAVRAVVRGPQHLSLRPGPALMVASDYRTLARHENYSQPRSDNWDRHDDVPALQHRLAGAIVARAVAGLDPAFPLLEVGDPIAALIALGAAARERFTGRVVGVTGTVGKSSTIAMLRDLLPQRARVLTTLDNYNSRVGVPATLANLAPDTDVCILEMAQSSLWMDRGPISLLARPHVGILTEIGVSQTRQTATVERTAMFKARLFLGLEPGGVAIVPDHIPCLEEVLATAACAAGAVWQVGRSPQAHVRLLEAMPEPGGACRVHLRMDGRRYAYRFPVESEGLLRNSLLAFAALVALGFDGEAACERMPHVRLPASVLQVHALNTCAGVQATLIDDSWNAEILSMRNAMALVRDWRRTDAGPVARKIAVLGRIVNLGKAAEAMHRSLAAPVLHAGLDWVVTHGEEMRWLREELPAAMLGPHFEDATKLVAYLSEMLRDGDLVLVKGDRVGSDFGRIPGLLLTP